MSTHQVNRYTQFITPLGGIIALTCFFLPWVKIKMDSRPISETFSGLMGIHNTPLIAIAFVACLLIICSSLYMIIRRTPRKSRVLILISGIIGLGGLWSEYFTYTRLVETSYIAETENLQLILRFGVWGTVVGFVVAGVGVFLTRAEKTEERSEMFVDERYAWFIAHAAAIGVLVCFFLPWEGIGAGSSFSGFDLGKWNPLIKIALIATVTIVGINFYMLWRQTLWKSKVPIFIGSGIGLGVLFSHYINYFSMLNTINKKGLEISANTLEFGLWGTAIGFVVAAVGMSLISTKNRNKQVEVPTESG